MAGAARSTPEDVELASSLASLSNPVRLTILRQLRAQRLITEIAVAAESDRTNPSDDRPISRQAVREHVRKLLEEGFVTARPAEHDFGESLAYTVNHRRLYALAEGLRGLATLRPEKDALDDPTVEIATWSSPRAEFPRLVLVRGLGEGTAFPLDAVRTRPAEWVIGRKKGVEVRLDYDPFVSIESAVVTAEGGRFRIVDLPGNRNGTFVNFQRLAPGTDHRLGHGDVVGVGRSLLVFQERPPER